MDSNAGILLLIGKPALGKTTFIRGLLDYTQSSATVSYDPKILERDQLFAEFIGDGDSNFLILEDSDTFLCSRTDGNNLMQRFLNVSDGLVSSKDKKMIFTTNLPSVRDIDPALIRKGRCFDILKFELLTKQQAAVLAADFGIDSIPDKNAYTIADVLNNNTSSSAASNFNFGFNQ